MKEGRRAATEGLLKIGELAKETDTSISTLKYYIREGLIRPVVKTGRNMSWYDPSCVETVSLIRMLQKERYYPLSVIRDLLKTDSLHRPPEMALLDAIHKVDDNTDYRVFTENDAVLMSGLERDQINALSEAGLISTSGKKRREVYTEEDLAVMNLVRVRLEAGIPLEQSIEALRIYDRALRSAAHEDIDSFVDLIMQPDFSAEAGAHMIRISDQTLDEFIMLRRKGYNRSYGKSYVGKLYRFMTQCGAALPKLEKACRAHGFTQAASICAAAAAGSFPENEKTASCLRMFLGNETGQSTDLIDKIAACQRGRDFFSSGICCDEDCSPDIRVLTDSLRCLWLTMAPDVLHCEDSAAEAADRLMHTLNGISPERGTRIFRDIRSCANTKA